MELITQTTDFSIKEPTAVAIGKFDGIHLGHRALLEEIFAAKAQGLKTAVFTFDPSPSAYFHALNAQILDGERVREEEREQTERGGEKAFVDLGSFLDGNREDFREGVRIRDQKSSPFRELLTKEEKRRLFEEMGVDYLVEYPFGRETAAVTPEDYTNRFLLTQMHAKLIVAGEDVSFGKNGAGNAEVLKELAKAYNEQNPEKDQVSIKIIPKICLHEQQISSTLVRGFVTQGQMEQTTEYLGQPFLISGTVERGNRIGHTLGMPTANLYPSPYKLLPPNGVYFSRCRTEDGNEYEGITNIGSKPTIGEKIPRISVETYLFDFDQELYDKKLEVRILHFCRPERKFSGLEELQAQMKQDADLCRSYFEENR